MLSCVDMYIVITFSLDFVPFFLVLWAKIHTSEHKRKKHRAPGSMHVKEHVLLGRGSPSFVRRFVDYNVVFLCVGRGKIGCGRILD